MKQATSLWKWEIPDTYPNKRIGVYNREISPDRFEFKKGKKIYDLDFIPSFSFSAELNQLRKIDILPNNSGSPLVSRKVGELLSDICKDNFQLIDVELKTEDGLLEGYKLLNITILVTTVDLEKSKYSLFSEGNNIRSFQKEVHKLEKIPSNLLAREQLYKSHIIVANDIFEAFRTHKINGVQFSSCSTN